MTTDDRDDRIDELLRESLHEEADAVVPSGDGLSRIQRRVAVGRSRQRWMRPVLAVASVLALVGAGVGAFALANGSGDNDKLVPGEDVTPTASETSTPTPSPTAVDVADAGFPKRAIFPFTTAAEEQAWEASYAEGHEPWKADPTAVAQFWVNNYLGEKGIDEVVEKQLAGDRARVTLGRTLEVEQRSTISVTTVRLMQYGKGWVVVGAEDPQDLLSLTSPRAGSTVTSPVTVTGPGYGVDEAAAIKVFDATKPGALGVEHVSYGAGLPEWSTSVSYEPTSSFGALVAVQDSAADGGPQRLVAQQVRFGTTTPGGEAPAYFYAVKNNRIAKFASRNGAAIEYLTEEEPGGGPSDPQLGATTGRVYFLQGSGTCSNALVSVSPSGGRQVRSVASPDAGYVISGYAVLEPSGEESNPDNPAIAYYEQACDSGSGPQAKLVMRTLNGEQSVVRFRAEPPGVQGDPTWDPDGTHVVAYVRTGTQGYLARYDATSGNDSTPDPVCSDGAPDGLPAALEMDATGDLWVVRQIGSTGFDVSMCAAGRWTDVFGTTSGSPPADIDVTADASAVLVTDLDGNVWRWDGGAPTPLSPSVPLDHVTW